MPQQQSPQPASIWQLGSPLQSKSITCKPAKRKKRQAKRKWQTSLPTKYQSEHFRDDLKATWAILISQEIIEGFNTYHKNYSPKTFTNRGGQISMNVKENASTSNKRYPI